jgi:Lrp/AsnC family transcriptional regulator, leucine-responsive regulatory protein
MDKGFSKLLDRTGYLILNTLQENARISFSELGRMVGLSSPAAAERVHKLEEAGLITGYHAHIPADKLGFPIQVYIRLRAPAEKYPQVLRVVRDLTGIIECHHVTGEDSFVMKAAVASPEHLEEMIAQLSPFGETATAIILSTPVERQWSILS